MPSTLKINQIYNDSFKLFLKSTNEKEVFEGALLEAGALKKQSTILDIGAGDGIFARRIKAYAMRYVAIEQNDIFAQNLRTITPEVIVGIYPDVDSKVRGAFDTVLSSYSSPIDYMQLENFIRTAWNRVDSGGRLAIITMGNHSDPWTQIMQELEARTPIGKLRGYSTDVEANYDRYLQLTTLCKRLGQTYESTITSTINADTMRDLYHVVGFLASAGVSEAISAYIDAQKTVMDVLERYTSGTPSLQHEHSIIIVCKTT